MNFMKPSKGKTLGVHSSRERGIGSASEKTRRQETRTGFAPRRPEQHKEWGSQRNSPDNLQEFPWNWKEDFAMHNGE